MSFLPETSKFWTLCMNALAERLQEFDDTLKRLCESESDDDIVSYLYNLFDGTDAAKVIPQRKCTIRNILGSNTSVFKKLFCALDRDQFDDFLVPKRIQDQIEEVEMTKLHQSFQHRIESPDVKFNRIEGRYRLFVNPDELSPDELESFCKIIALLNSAAEECTLETVLFESIQPTDFPHIELDNWHFDCLKDQIKIFIPLNNTGQLNAPMRIIEGPTTLSNYPDLVWEKLHTAFKISGLSVAASNYVEPSLAKEMGDIRHVTAKPGEIVAFNPKSIHTGSLCKNGTRQSITLYLKKNSFRNKMLGLLFS